MEATEHNYLHERVSAKTKTPHVPDAQTKQERSMGNC